MAEPIVQILLRVPPDLKKHLEAAAKMNQRSLNNEAIIRLSRSFEGEVLRGDPSAVVAASRIREDIERIRKDFETLQAALDKQNLDSQKESK